MSDEIKINPNLILPAGTMVVTRIKCKLLSGKGCRDAGEVGVITRSPMDNSHAYRVRFPDGIEASLYRHEIAMLKHFQKECLKKKDDILSEFNLHDYIIYRCVVGSKAYGLNEENSDTDIRGIYLPPAEMHWSLYGVPEQLESDGTQECYWEIQKFIMLALKANPNILECLYTPLVEMTTVLTQELLDMRQIFLSRLVYQTYNGYVLSQFKKLDQHMTNKGSIKWKHAMHLIRLLLSGITILKEGYVPVHIDSHREELLAIRRGEITWNKVNARRLKLHKEFEEAFIITRLPQNPDYEKANVFLVKARKSKV